MKRLSVPKIGQFCLAFTLASGFVGLRAQSPATDAHQQAPTPEEAQARKVWREAIHALPAPSAGCFHSSYPNTQWEEVACEDPKPLRFTRQISHGPETEGSTPLTLGDGSDYVAQAPYGHHIKVALGEFTAWKNLKSEKGGGYPNQYTLQLNTNNDYKSPACDGYSGCFSWQQYIISSDFYPIGGHGPTGKTETFIQDWLIGYGYKPGICPSGWTYSQPFGNASQCFRNSKAAVVYNGQIPIYNLPQLALEGSANDDGTDQVEAFYGKDAYRVSTPDTLTDIGFDWSQAEFNVFGNGGSSGADFNSGAGLEVAVLLDYGSSAAPICQPPSKRLGTTGETNNLKPDGCATGFDNYPYIEFIETN
jgi:hypothetical protein